MLCAAVLLACLALLATLAPVVHSELLGVILVSRHGTRAPNAVTTQLCPANAENLARYLHLQISLEGVTGRGMQQLVQLGEWCKQRYVDSGFLQPYYRNSDLYIRAVGEDRTLQSAVAWGQGMFPSGHGPVGFPQSLPSPLPVYTLPDELDTLLENRKAGCHARLKKDVLEYDNTIGLQDRASHAALLSEIESLCGVNLTEAIVGSGDNYGDSIKDITDNWTFDFVEHFPPLHGLTQEKLLQFRAFAVRQLIGRILGSDDQITYMNGDLPLSMVKTFRQLVEQRESERQEQASDGAAVSAGKKPLKFIAYHGHREMMYALAAFFDIQFNITYPALPLGAIPAATTLLFEMHERDGDYEVRALVWTPCDDTEELRRSFVSIDESAVFHGLNQSANGSSVPSNVSYTHGQHSRNNDTARSESSPSEWRRTSANECGARAIAIGKCERGVCSLNEFKHAVNEQIKRTGDWQSLCAEDEDKNNDSAEERETKVPGAGKTQPHSRGYRDTEVKDDDKDSHAQRSNHSRATTSSSRHSVMHGHAHGETTDEDADAHSSTGRSAAAAIKAKAPRVGTMMTVFWVLVAAAMIGGALYYCCVHRARNPEYQRV